MAVAQSMCAPTQNYSNCVVHQHYHITCGCQGGNDHGHPSATPAGPSPDCESPSAHQTQGCTSAPMTRAVSAPLPLPKILFCLAAFALLTAIVVRHFSAF